MLDSEQKNSVEKATIFYEAGLVYDDLGLESMARFMMMNAIVNKPDYAAAYELIGVYYLKDGRMDGDLTLPPYNKETEKEREEEVYQFLKARNW